MQFLTHNDKEIETHGTFLVGTLQATRTELQFAFGEPASGSDKTTTEWHLQFADGLVATIYDWKEPQPPGLKDVVTWRIGSDSAFAVTRVHETFRRALHRLQSGNRRVA